MIAAVTLKGRFWRVLSPRWAHRPLDGSGAARNGGRWNRPGAAALYMSGAFQTAVAEYQQELSVRPGTFVAYDVSADRVADLTSAESRETLGVALEDLAGPWKPLALIRRGTPATWLLADRLAVGAQGAMVPSAVDPAGLNLVLWRWNCPDGASVTALDPAMDLPKRP